MHILVFERKPDNRLGGQERSLFEVTTGLVERGFSVSLVYRTPGNLLPEYEAMCETTTQVEHPYYLSSRHLHLQLKSALGLAATHYSSPWDVLYTNQYHDTPFAYLLGRIIRRPLVCHLRLAVSGYLSRQYKWVLNQCRELIPISHHTAGTYSAAGITNSAMTVVYNGIDTSKFTPEPAPDYDGRRIVYLGRITRQKGLTTLINAFQRLSASRDDLELRIIGGGTDIEDETYASEIRETAQQGSGTVRFISHVQDVRPLLAASDLLVLPSEWGEPFGRVLIEAMACGIPVVATRDGGIPEVLAPEFDDHLVVPQSPSDLARTINDVVDWRDTQPELGAKVRRYVEERFTVDRTIDQIAARLKRAVDTD